MAAAVLIYADSMRSPEMRHEVPLPVPDAFLYAERDGRRVAVAHSLETARLAQLDGLEVVPLEDLGLDELFRQGLDRYHVDLELALRACQRLGIESAIVPDTFPLGLADHLRAHGVEVRADKEHFDARRRVKSPVELAGIRRAQRASEAGLRAALALLRAAEPRGDLLVLDGEPLTCERLKDAVERTLGEHGAFADEFIVAHGPQTALGHDMGSGPVGARDVVLFDLFPRDRETGCYADITRTYAVGEPDAELLEYHRLCREALERAVAAIRPGVTGAELFEATCRFFEEHGQRTQLSRREGERLESGFVHALGHGVGLDVHEEPYLGRAGQPLVAGDVVAVEPGLYRRGYGGVRLEDLVLVTEDGAEVLTDFPYDLVP